MRKASSKKGKLSKGLSIDRELFEKVMEVARREERPFAFIVRRAIERDLVENRVSSETPQYVGQYEELIDIKAVGRMLKLSVWTIRRRSRQVGDPLRLAKSRIGKKKPMHFVRSKIELMERGG